MRLVRNPDYRSASALYSLDLALQIAEPCAADEGLCISSGECIYDDAAIERVLSVSGSALAVDSSRYVASSTKVIAENGDVLFTGTGIPKHAATAVVTGLCKLDAHACGVLSAIAAESTAEKRDAPIAVALGDLIRRARMTLVDIAGTKWASVRTMDDLQAADKRFSRFSCPASDVSSSTWTGPCTWGTSRSVAPLSSSAAI
jgi:choline kinase